MKYLKLFEQFDVFDPFGEERHTTHIENIVKKVQNEELDIFETETKAYFVESDDNVEFYTIFEFGGEYYLTGQTEDRTEIDEEIISKEDYEKIRDLYLKYGKK